MTDIQIEAIKIAMQLNPEVKDFKSLIPVVNEITDFLLAEYPPKSETDNLQKQD